MIKTIYTKEAPEALGPYSQAVKAGNMLFTSGQIPIDPKTGQAITSIPATDDVKNFSYTLERVYAILYKT